MSRYEGPDPIGPELRTPIMRRYLLYVFVAFAALGVLFSGVRKMFAQSNLPPSMVTRAVDETQRVSLRGNVVPMARAENDQGAVASTMQIDHMLLVLKRSPEQETALDNLIAQQADKNSPNYHKWLTPAQFGEQFGASDQDITAVTTWLGSHGFQVNSVANGRDMIDFSGTAGEIQEAFHTEIHSYRVNGQNHFANASDPQIPAALAPIVAGVNRLNSFRPKPMMRKLGAFKMELPSRRVTPVNPEFTLTDAGCYGNNTPCYGIGAYDFATIYNLLPIWNATCGSNPCNGTGVNVALVSDSNINSADVTQFRSLMGLPAQTVNVKLATGVDPGLQNCSADTDEQEAILDVEWVGAAAPGATIDLVVAPTAGSCGNPSTTGETNLPSGDTFGGDYAAYYAVNTLNDPILTDSYGACELSLGTAANSFYKTLWQQADTQGITVITASGDNGAAGCDATTAPAQSGLQVNGASSTPYDVSVGATEFTYTTASGAATYWNSSNSSTGNSSLSAKGPIPETVYNDTCTNPQLSSFLGTTNIFNACNSVNAANSSPSVLVAIGSSGGFSNCAAPTGLAATDCAGGYAKPSWQTAGTPSDSHRDIPDVSLFGGDGTISGTFYIVCEEDAFINSNPPSPPTACSLTGSSAFFAADGGTSVSAQAFGGIVALLDQYQSNAQGKTVRYGSTAFNTQLYALAASQSASSCNNSGSTPLANSSPCIFRDVTSGNNSVPCNTGTTNCGNTISTFVPPASVDRPWIRFRWTPLGVSLLVCTICAAIFLLLVDDKRRRWSAALAVVVFAAMFGVVSCGGGGSTPVAPTPPTVTGVSPNAGPTAGGTQVVITGSNLSGATTVMFGGTAAASFTVSPPTQNTQITAVSPAESAGTVNITVTTAGGTSAILAADQFTFTANPPAVTGVSPNVGPTTGGTQVVITGSNMSGATTVMFGSTAAASFTLNSATQITAVSPAEGAGTVNVTVTAAGGTSATSTADQFTFYAAPTVTGISPNSGGTVGGTQVVINGSNLGGATAVKFGGAAAASFAVNSATQITAVSPAESAGMVNITVTTPGGTSASSAADQFAFYAVGVLSGYNAATGYDRATGLGSVNAANLIKAAGW